MEQSKKRWRTKRGWMSEYDDFVMERRGDVELAERLLSRDESALRMVIELYGGPVHGMARRVITEPNLAEEVAQDTFLALWRRPGAFDPGRGSLQSFLLGVARNKAIDLVRREESVKRKRESLEAEMRAAPAEHLRLAGDRGETRGSRCVGPLIRRSARSFGPRLLRGPDVQRGRRGVGDPRGDGEDQTERRADQVARHTGDS